MSKLTHIIRSISPGALLILAISVAVFSYVVYSWVTFKNEQVENTFRTARTIVAVFPKENLKYLETGPADLEKPAYQSIKKALAAAIKANPEAKFAYLFVEKNDKVYFAADSEPENSKDYSPPGQEYAEARLVDKQPFRDGKEVITQEVKDRWGTWRTVFIPIKDDITGKPIAVFGMDIYAKTWNNYLIFHVIQSSLIILLLGVFILVFRFQIQNKSLLHEISERKKAEEKLRKSLNHNRALLEANPDIMFIFDAECRIIDYHSESTDKLIAPPEVFLGKTLEGLFPPEIVAMTNDKIKAVLATGQAQYSTYEITADGEIKYFESRYVSCGKNQVLSIVRDISNKKLAEDALRLNEERLRLSLSAAKQGLYDLNVQTDNAIVNDEYATMLGYDPKTFVETNSFWIERLHPDDLLSTSKAYDDYITGKTSEYRVEFRQKNSDNNWKWILSVGKIVEYDAGGKPLRMLGTHVDITQRKLAEEFLRHSEEKYRMLTETMKDVVWIIDTQLFKFTYVSPSVEKLRGYTAEEIMAQPIEASILSEGAENQIAIMNQRIQEFMSNPDSEDKFYCDEQLQPCKDGSSIWVELVYKYYRNPETGHIELHGVSRDITERKKHEEQIKLQNEELINLNATKDKFFSIIAHDLRSPFSSFLGLTQIMAEELPNLTMAEIQDIAINMSKSATNLSRLLENLLQWSLVQQKRMIFKPETVQLQSLVDDCVLMIQETASKKGILLTTDIPDELKIVADTNAIQTIIRNLVSNGIKYTKTGGSVHITAHTKSNGFIELSVADTGIGMNQTMVNNLFKIDVHTNRPGTEGEPSTGLGLLLCKEFVEKHGGQINVESIEGKGSTFRFTIPIYS